MENWGLITYVEALLCVDPQTSAASGKFDVAALISHELAHQVGTHDTHQVTNCIYIYVCVCVCVCC